MVFARPSVHIPIHKHLALDGWSSPDVMSILGIILTYVEDGQVKTLTLDTVRLLVSPWNASDNTTMIEELPHLLPSESMTSPETQIRCILHIVELLVKNTLGIFDEPKDQHSANDGQNTNIEDSHDDELDLDDEIGFDDEIVVGEDVETEYEEVEDRSPELADAAELNELNHNLEEVKALTSAEKWTGWNTLLKLRKLAIEFRNHDYLQNKLVQACKTEGIEPKKMIRPIDTCWNTMSYVIDRGLYLRKALDRVVSMGKYANKGKGKKKLVHLKLSAM
ncbi:hypothetical protein K435DRAFT_859813 [Dendrothele bispora CBS 962.96]|uniref:Uncharacterized protein n=1 Tax=Dendrothele bispora (strain CBS 962.96) TaxID=1314807 RepID=A0A4S8M076_DENBC|nr:hypothetical protein K435DRAFT_859813 [Dendrothele bispora CBS 962.96]